MKGNDMGESQFNRGPARRPMTAAEKPRDRLYAAHYPAKTYVIHATSPEQFQVELVYHDYTLQELHDVLRQLIDLGWSI